MGFFKKRNKKDNAVAKIETDISNSSLSKKKARIRKQRVVVPYATFSLNRMKNSVFPFISLKELASNDKAQYILYIPQSKQRFTGNSIFDVFGQWLLNIVEKEPTHLQFMKSCLKSDKYDVYHLFSDYRVSPRDVKLADGLFYSPFHKDDIERQYSGQQLIYQASIIGSFLLQDIELTEIVYDGSAVQSLSFENNEIVAKESDDHIPQILDKNKETLFERQLKDDSDDVGFKDLFG